jgi:hypothetical protein
MPLHCSKRTMRPFRPISGPGGILCTESWVFLSASHRCRSGHSGPQDTPKQSTCEAPLESRKKILTSTKGQLQLGNTE